jgi:hypothetical protein
MTTLCGALLLACGGAIAADYCTAATTDLDGHVVAFESQPLNLDSCFGNAEEFVFRAWPPDATTEQSQLIRVRYVWDEGGEPPPDDLRRREPRSVDALFSAGPWVSCRGHCNRYNSAVLRFAIG